MSDYMQNVPDCDGTIREALRLADELLDLADQGDFARQDVGCGVLYGTIRDCAYKIRMMARAELEAHRRQDDPADRKAGSDVGLHG